MKLKLVYYGRAELIKRIYRESGNVDAPQTIQVRKGANPIIVPFPSADPEGYDHVAVYVWE